MKNHIDLGAETVAFVRMRMMEVVGEDPENIKRVEWNSKEVKEQIFRLFYDYQVVRGWRLSCCIVITNKCSKIDAKSKQFSFLCPYTCVYGIFLFK